MTYTFLFVVALLGGALNSVAGGGSFITLPALIYAGVAPVAANATSTLAMWPASLASSVAYRREIATVRGWLIWLGGVSLLGGLLGGVLLVKTSDARFLALLPWLMLAATVTFTFGGRLTDRLRRGRAPAAPVDTPVPARRADRALWILALQFVISIYGGYFGGGMGIMMLAALSIAGMTNIHEMNGVKTMLAVAINGVALATFVANGAIVWAPGLIMVAGGVTGGYAGAALARRGGPEAIRAFVISVAWLMTVYFFVR